MPKKNKNKKPKKATFSPPPPQRKHPRWLGEPTFEGRHLSWRFSSCDKAGAWSWPPRAAGHLKDIVSKLSSFEGMNYHTGLKDIRSRFATRDLEPAAKRRLRELKLDDVETLYAWHIGQKERLWCTEYDGAMCVLWWDTDHEVYSVKKKNT